MFFFPQKKSPCVTLRNGSLFLFLLNSICHILVTGDIGIVMEHGMVQLCLTAAALTQANLLILSFLTHFINPKSGIPNSNINFVFSSQLI